MTFATIAVIAFATISMLVSILLWCIIKDKELEQHCTSTFNLYETIELFWSEIELGYIDRYDFERYIKDIIMEATNDK